MPYKELDTIHARLANANGIGLDEVVARHYRHDVPKLLAAVEAVLALHTTTMRKVRVYEPGRLSFGDLVERPFCSHCKHAGDAPHPWPRPTVQAINDALLASEPPGSEQ